MKNSKWLVALFLVAVTPVFFHGCSSSSGPAQQSFPLSLNLLLPQNYHPIFDTLRFQVTQNGKGVAGAKLTSLTDPYYVFNSDLGVRSDTAGKFPPLFITYNDSFAAIAYQALLDTFESNYYTWNWQ